MPIAVKLVLSMLLLWPGLFFHASNADCANGYPGAMFSPMYVPWLYPQSLMRALHVRPMGRSLWSK